MYLETPDVHHDLSLSSLVQNDLNFHVGKLPCLFPQPELGWSHTEIHTKATLQKFIQSDVMILQLWIPSFA